MADQDDLQKAYSKAIDKKYYSKADVLKSFLIKDGLKNGEQINPVRSKRHITKYLDRRRGDKTDRIEQKPISRFKNRKALAILEGESDSTTLS